MKTLWGLLVLALVVCVICTPAQARHNSIRSIEDVSFDMPTGPRYQMPHNPIIRSISMTFYRATIALDK